MPVERKPPVRIPGSGKRPTEGWLPSDPPPGPLVLLPSKFWPIESLKHVTSQIERWPDIGERMRVYDGIMKLYGGIIVPTDDTWWIPLPAQFALVGPFQKKDRPGPKGNVVEIWYDAPSSILKKTETARAGQMVKNKYLDRTEQYAWRGILQMQPKLAAQFVIESMLKFSIDCVRLMCESRGMIGESREELTPLAEADRRAIYLRVMREMREHPSKESYQRGLRLFANMPLERTPEEDELRFEFWNALSDLHEHAGCFTAESMQ